MLVSGAVCGVFPGDGIDLHGLLNEAVKQFSAALGCASVETERELVEIVIQVFVAHRALMSLTFRMYVQKYLVNFWPPEFCWSAAGASV
jgi:hypothetical protein